MTDRKEGRLAGKTALVTGGSRGIGRAIIERLAAEGAGFIGIQYSSHPDAAAEVVGMVNALGIQAVALRAEFSADGKGASQRLWSEFAHAVTEKLGTPGVDILVNCAGIAPLATLEDTTETLYEEVLSINLAAPFFLIQAAGPHIRRGGRIINLSSALTRIAAPSRAIYAASKGAINTLTLALAAEYGPRGITVNAVAPGVIDTDMNSAWLGRAQERAQAESMSVLSRVGQPGDVADVVVFLASDDSRWITGQVIDVSGGTAL